MSLEYTQEEETKRPDEEEHYGPPVKPSTPIYTCILLACIAAVFAVQYIASGGNSLLLGDNRTILAAGFVKQAFVRHGEYWRILTGATLHAGILHAGMNSYALYSFGRIFELLSNRAHLAIVFLLAAIGGGLLSLFFLPDGVSVGASGGIVGLIGYLAVYAFRRRQFISNEFRKNLLVNIGFILVFGLVLYQVIDNYGHIGGLLTGAVYGFFQIPGDEYVDPRAAGSTTRLAGLAALAIYIAGSILTIVLLLRLR